MTLSQRIGDNRTYRIPLRWGNAAFTPTGYFLMFTCKVDEDDEDDDSVIQKTSDLGITVSGTSALLNLIPYDTAGGDDPELREPLTPATYYWDIQAQSDSDPTDVRTVASGRLVLQRDIGQGNETAVPVYVANPGISYDTQILTYS